MSVRVQTYVWQLELSPYQKLVAIALADHCQDDGSEARPSQDRLARKTGLSRRGIQKILQQLVEAGVIILDKRGFQHYANIYRFPLPEDFATLRREPRSPLTQTPDANGVRQMRTARRPDANGVRPNHKEPSIETEKQISIPMPPGFKDVFRNSTGAEADPSDT
jgi:hypothetical protein